MPSVTRGTISKPTPRALSARPNASLSRAERRARQHRCRQVGAWHHCTCRNTFTCSESAVFMTTKRALPVRRAPIHPPKKFAWNHAGGGRDGQEQRHPPRRQRDDVCHEEHIYSVKELLQPCDPTTLLSVTTLTRDTLMSMTPGRSTQCTRRALTEHNKGRRRGD